MIGRNRGIIEKVVKKWTMKTEIKISSFAVSRSSIRNCKVEDIYLRYIQFGTLHRLFYTNKILCKMGIKDIQLWSNAEDWINEIGLVEYNLTNKIKNIG